MINNIRKYFSSTLKDAIINLFIYRIYNRFCLRYHELRISCELTTRCNTSCDMCTRPSFVKEKQLSVGDMEPQVLERVVQEIKKIHEAKKQVYFVPMGLGEPLLYDGLFDLFEKIKKISKKIKIVLVTNGILLNETIAHKIISLDIDEVCVSLNVNNPVAYREHMGTDNYKKVCGNIENLINLRNQKNRLTPSVFVQYIDYDKNVEVFDNDIKRWYKIMRHNDKCFIHPVVNQAGFFSGGNDFGCKTYQFPCTQPLWRIAIKRNGDIYPCDSSLYSGPHIIRSLYLGNIKDVSPLELFVLNNRKVSSIVQKMRFDDYSGLPECQQCNTCKLSVNCYFLIPNFLRFSGKKWL